MKNRNKKTKPLVARVNNRVEMLSRLPAVESAHQAHRIESPNTRSLPQQLLKMCSDPFETGCGAVIGHRDPTFRSAYTTCDDTCPWCNLVLVGS